MNEINDFLINRYDVTKEQIEFVENSMKEISYRFLELDKIREYNQYKVLSAFNDNRLSATDFYWTTGYGYGDIGRDKVEAIYSTSEKSMPLNLPNVDRAPAYPIISGFSSSSLSVITAMSFTTFNCILVPRSALIALKGLLTGEQQFSTSTSLLLKYINLFLVVWALIANSLRDP